MNTIAKKRAAKKSAVKNTSRRPAAGKLTLEPEILSLAGTRIPPLGKSTTAELLRSLRDGSFDRAAANADWKIVEAVVRNRRSSATLRAAHK